MHKQIDIWKKNWGEILPLIFWNQKFLIFFPANDEITLISKEADKMCTMLISSLAHMTNQALISIYIQGMYIDVGTILSKMWSYIHK